jgi:hypothetical protein
MVPRITERPVCGGCRTLARFEKSRAIVDIETGRSLAYARDVWLWLCDPCREIVGYTDVPLD